MTKTTTFVLSVLLAATSPISSVPNAAGTASLYVAKNGSDSYSCAQAASPSTPKLTIGNALDCISPSPGAGANKIIEIAAGTYAEAVSRGNQFPKGSSWSAPFTMRAKTGDTVIIKPNSGSLIINLNDEDTGTPFYAIIQGLTFDGTNISTTSGSSVVFASFVRMLGNEFVNTQACNAFMGSKANLEFINNKIHGGNFSCGGGAGGDSGYPIYHGGHDALFEGNELYDFPTFGLHLYPGPQNAVIRNNIVRDFGWAKNCPGGDPRCNGRFPDDRGVGILVAGTGHKVYNNVVFNGTVGIHAYTRPGKEIYNNTVFNMSNGGILSDQSDGNIVRNNIVYNPTRPRDGDIFSWQVPDSTTYSNNLCARSGTGCSVVANPLFADAENGNFNLQSSSPAGGIGAAP